MRQYLRPLVDFSALNIFKTFGIKSVHKSTKYYTNVIVVFGHFNANIPTYYTFKWDYNLLHLPMTLRCAGRLIFLPMKRCMQAVSTLYAKVKLHGWLQRLHMYCTDIPVVSNSFNSPQKAQCKCLYQNVKLLTWMCSYISMQNRRCPPHGDAK